MLYSTRVTTEKELQQIMDLQQLNLRGISKEVTEKEQGFVTVPIP
ncbi:MAG: hypothetical protein ABI813_04130 [Bacteroidota bacterium]